MPVDLGIGNAIINAYIAGQNQRRQKEEFKVKSEQDAAELEERKKQHEADLKQHADEFEKTYALNKAVHDLALFRSRQEAGKDITESGIIPSDTTVTTPQFSAPEGIGNQPIARDLTGIPKGMVEVENATLGKIRIPSHETYIKQKAEEAEAVEAPKRLTRTQVEDIKAETKKATTSEIEDNKKQLLQTKLDAEKAEQQLELKNRIEVANIKGNYALKAKQLSVEANLKKLPQAIRDKVDNFNLLENKTQLLKEKLEKTYSDGQTGFEKFYKGKIAGGTLQNIKEAFSPDADADDIFQLSADVEADAKNLIGKFGGALTKTELDILENMAPSPNRNLTASRARAIINGFLLGVQNIKGEIADQNKVGQAQGPIRIKVDEKGNVIK